MDKEHVEFRLGQSNTGLPLNETVREKIASAAKGGDATAQYFQEQNLAYHFTNYIKELDENAWIWSEDLKGNPVVFTAQQSGDNTITMTLRPVADENVAQGKTQPEQFSWEGKNYNIVGTITATLAYNEQPLWYVQVPLGLVEAFPIGRLAKLAWSGLVKPMLRGFWIGIRQCFSAGARAAAGAAVEVAEAAAGEAEVVGEEVAGDVVVSMSVGAVAFTVMVVLIAIPIIIEIIAHPSFHNIKLYNLTPYNITWKDPYLDTTAMNIAPKDTKCIPAISSFRPQPDIKPVETAYEAGYSFASESTLKGIGWAMLYNLTDPKNSNEEIAEAAVGFDLPFAGDNSLYCSFGKVENLENFYNKMEGKHKQLKYETTLTDRNIKLTVTYDYLSGKHPSPSGQNLYYYNTMIVFSTTS